MKAVVGLNLAVKTDLMVRRERERGGEDEGEREGGRG